MSAFRAQITAFADKTLSPQALAARVAVMARAERDKLIRAGRASPRYRTFVDGMEGGREEDARQTILYEFSQLADAVVYALDYRQARSPVESGNYRDGFMIAIDGRPVRAAGFNAAAVPFDAEVIIYNRMPYGRKVDVQLVGTKRLHFSVPAGLFDGAAKGVARRFGNSVTAKRLYSVNVPGQWRRKRGEVGRLVEYPALQLNARG